MDNLKVYRKISRGIAQLISLAKMYKHEHPMVVKKAEEVYKDIFDFFSESKQSIVFAKSADILLLNGEKVESDNNLMKKFIEDFSVLDVGSVELEPGLTTRDLRAFILLMCHAEKTSGVEKIKQFLTEKNASHLTARAATFKLVQENEDIVKKGEFVKVEDIPPEVLLRFSDDFKQGRVHDGLKGSGKEYKLAAHNSTFLAGMAFDLLKEKGPRSAPEDMEKVLWLMADYLIDEIGSFKEENLNRGVLEEVKAKLLAKWEGKPEQKELSEHVEKTYKIINTALQLKGLLALYKKHKKSMDTAAKKINGILKNLPQESQLYQKTVKSMAQTD